MTLTKTLIKLVDEHGFDTVDQALHSNAVERGECGCGKRLTAAADKVDGFCNECAIELEKVHAAFGEAI